MFGGSSFGAVPFGGVTTPVVAAAGAIVVPQSLQPIEAGTVQLAGIQPIESGV